MSDEQLDHILASASATLTSTVKNSTDVNVLLGRLLGIRPDKSLAALQPFMARIRLRRILGELYRAEVLTESLVKIAPDSEILASVSSALRLAFVKACADNFEDVEDLVHLLNVAVARALAATMSPTETNDTLLEGYISALLRALVIALGRCLSWASDLAIDLPHIPKANNEIATRDLCGVDLCRHEIGSIQMLYNFIWDEKTVWPAALENQARNKSDLIGNGIYRIRSMAPFQFMATGSLDDRRVCSSSSVSL
ncbi:hypothetical protein [Thermoactinospora rubra]|uniref:hypothetical protein n=1 Tax=Thermoactinospora rubra TaxID=1088767 RepID=UPI00117CF8B3|nr:hypothetical protein [Thermoactinospora rubra]